MDKPRSHSAANPPSATGGAGLQSVRVADLRPGMQAGSVFVVKKCVRREQPNGAPFLLFQFSDRTGQINGVLWDERLATDALVTSGDLAFVQGDVQTYQNTRQIRVRRIELADPAAYDLSEFLPRSQCDVEALWQRVLARIDAVQDPFLKRLYGDLFQDPAFAARYRMAPAGKGWHHAYVGGLLEHAVSMLEIAAVLERQHPAMNADLVAGGVLLHDVGKIDELALRSHIEYTLSGRLVGHLVQGCMLIGRAMDRIEGFPEELRLRLLHILVSHHGALDRGSPKVPMTLEAVVVHLIDHLDSQAHGVDAVVARGAGEDGWTENVKLLDRFLYVGRGVPDAVRTVDDGNGPAGTLPA
jgi:3'-5' exoribonuclease